MKTLHRHTFYKRIIPKLTSHSVFFLFNLFYFPTEKIIFEKHCTFSNKEALHAHIFLFFVVFQNHNWKYYFLEKKKIVNPVFSSSAFFPNFLVSQSIYRMISINLEKSISLQKQKITFEFFILAN